MLLQRISLDIMFVPSLIWSCNGSLLGRLSPCPPQKRSCNSPQVPEAENEGSVFAQLQGLFAQLALSKSTFAQPLRFWQAFKDYDGSPIDVREHQDAYEFFTRLQVR